HAEDVAASVNMVVVQLGLLRRHVLQRADDGTQAGDHGSARQLLTGCLRYAEGDHLDDWFAVIRCHEHIARLQVAMNDSFLVRMLDRVAYGDEQLQSLPGRKMVI